MYRHQSSGEAEIESEIGRGSGGPDSRARSECQCRSGIPTQDSGFCVQSGYHRTTDNLWFTRD